MRVLLFGVLLVCLSTFAEGVGPWTNLASRQTDVSGVLPEGGVHWYRFNGFAPGSCFWVSEDADFDVLYGLYNETDGLVRTADFNLTGIADTNGEIKVAVSGWNDNQFVGSHTRSGAYALALHVTEPQNDGNSNFASSTMVPAGQAWFASTLFPVPCGKGDVDFLTYTLPVGACWSTSIVRSFDEIFGLFAPNGTLLRTADSSLNGIVDSTGQVHIAISGWNDNTFVGDHTRSGDYNLTLVVTTYPETTDNTFATRRILPAGQNVATGNIWAVTGNCAKGDVDFITFTLTPGVCAQTSIVRPFDEIFGLFADNGTLIQTADSQITTNVPASGFLNLAISGWNDNQFVGDHSRSGDYTLTINTFTTASDGNNNFASATVVNWSTSKSFISQLEQVSTPCAASGDVDFIKFTNLPPGHCWNTLMSRSFDEILGWYHSNGTQLDVDDISLAGKVPGNGEIIVAVSGWNDNQFVGSHSRSGDYNLTIQTTPPVADDGNDVFQSRTVLAAGQTSVSADLHALAPPPCDTVGDVDFYEFQVTAGSCFETTRTATFDDMIAWYDSNGTMISYVDDTTLTGVVPANGKLILAVTGFNDRSFIGSHSRSGNYTLGVVLATALTDASESLQTAVFTFGSVVNGNLYQASACGGGDVDYFILLATAGSCFYTNKTTSFNDYLGVFSSSQVLIDSDENDLAGFVPSDGVLYLAVTGSPDTSFTKAHMQSGTYSIQLNTETVVADNDNTFAQRKTIPFANLPITGGLNSYVHCQGTGDVDFFTITNLPPGACFQTQITRDFDELWGLFDDNGTLIDTDDNGFTATVPASGRINLALTGWNDSGFVGDHARTGTYTVNLTVTSNQIVEDGNDSFQTAVVLPLGTTVYQGNLFAVQDTTPCPEDNRASDVDFVTFTVDPAGGCVLTADMETSGFDDYFGYFNRGGQLVWGQDTGSRTVQADGTGLVTFGLTAWPDTNFTGAHSSSGNYTFTVALDCGSPAPGFSRVLGGGRAVTSTIAPGEVDKWTFEQLPAGACFSTNMVRDFDELLGWFDDDGVKLDDDDNTITGIVPESGQVNIGVTGWFDPDFVGDHTRSGTYTLSIQISQNDPPPPSDGNDSFDQRMTTSARNVSGSIWATVDRTPCPNDANTVNDVDYYTFTQLTPGYCVATRMVENFDSAVALLDDTGAILDWEDYTLYALVPASGHVNLAVTGYPDRNLTGAHQKNGNYTLNLDVTHNDAPPASDGNNVFNTPTVLPFDQMAVSGSIWSLTDNTPCPGDFTPMGDVDFYRFGPLTPGHCFQTHMDRNFDEILGWYNGDTGGLIEYQDNQITGIVPASGLVYIAVSGWPDFDFTGDHQKNGNYTLSITTSFNAPPPESDGNDVFENSTMLEPGQNSVSDSIWATIDQTPCPNDHNLVNDVDFWSFQGLQVGSCFETIMDRDFDEYLGWFDNQGMLLDAQDYRVVGRIPDDGRVNIAVTGWYDRDFNGSHTRNGDYTLRLSVTRNDEPGEMVDNEFVNRVILPPGQHTVTGALWAIRDRTPCPDDVGPSDVDFFTFTGLEPGVCFRTETDRDFDEILGWYGDDGIQMTWSDYNIWGVVPASGNVNLAMSGWADSLFVGRHTWQGKYELSIVMDRECGGTGSGGGSGGIGAWCGNNCGDKSCGSDGCGGYCGACNAGEFCVYDGTCSSTCDSLCTDDQQCGLDGCGGYCGVCEGPQDVCSGGQCVCVGDCSARECGDDGCGGSCGTCEGQDECFDGSCVCVPNCDDAECGWDGCGGICGVCGPYYTCGDEGYCVRDPMTQPSCDDYFGYPHNEVSLTLLREVNSLLRREIRSTIDNLEDMRDALLEYDPDSQVLDLAHLIDQLHLFCSGPYMNDTCLSLSEIEFVESAFLNAIHVVTLNPNEECAGRVCGTTKYGGSCGSCPTGQQCTDDGQCVCSYDCSERQCGMAVQPEGTSLALCPESSCGTCPNRYECNMDYQCVKVPHPPVTLQVVDCESREPINVEGMIEITSEPIEYMEAHSYLSGGQAMWIPPDHEGIFNFSLTARGYESGADERSIIFETDSLDFCLDRSTFPLTIRDSQTMDMVETECSISWNIEEYSSESMTPPNPATLTIPDNGFGMYEFQVDCFGYDSKQESVEVNEPAGEVTIFVQRSPVNLALVNCETSELLGVTGSITVSSAESEYSMTFDLAAFSTASWVPPFSGPFDFATSGHGYQSSGENRQVDLGLGELIFCLERSTFAVQVVDAGDDSLVTEACVVEFMAPGAEQGGLQPTPPNPFTTQIPDNGYGMWSFGASCPGYQDTNDTMIEVQMDTTLVTILVMRRPVILSLTDCTGGDLLTVNSEVVISSESGYSLMIEVPASTMIPWVPPTLGAYTVELMAVGYGGKTEALVVDSTTETAEYCLDRLSVEVQVVAEGSGELVNSFCSVTIQRSGEDTHTSVLTPPNPFVWTLPDYPYDEWNFVTSCEGYNGKVDSFEVTPETDMITIVVSRSSLTLTVSDCDSQALLAVDAEVMINDGETVMTVMVPAGTPTGYTPGSTGTHTLSVSAQGYISVEGAEYEIDETTTAIDICLDPMPTTECGDGMCNGDEDFELCATDCAAAIFEFERADGSGPVNSMTVNYYSENPRMDSEMGPVLTGASASLSRQAPDSSNLVIYGGASYNQMIWIEATHEETVDFYWTVDTSLLNVNFNLFKLRVHLSNHFGGTDLNYRFVNTWRPIDDEPAPYAPTDLNLHLFHPAGALDINHRSLENGGFEIGRAVADSKQSGGPATMDLSSGSGEVVGVWNSKPPRDSAVAPSQNGRRLIDSGSYVVVYGKTSDAPTGKQLGQVLLKDVDMSGQQVNSDLWYVMEFTADQPGQTQPEIKAMGQLGEAAIDNTDAMIFDCQLYDYCASFVVPFSDSSRR